MAITRKSLFGKLNTTLFRSIEGATALCKLKGNPYVELVHWVNQLWGQEQNNDLKLIIAYFRVDAAVLERELANALSRLPGGANEISDFSWQLELAIERAWVYATLECGDSRIRSGHLLLAIAGNMELRRALFNIAPSLERLPLEELSRELNAITAESPEIFESAQEGDQAPGESINALSVRQNGSLANYSTDLTAMAREGKIDPVLGRDREIGTMIDILLRRRQNNPLLTGEAGVGKTAVVEGLAQAIVSGNVPPALSQVRLLALDIVALSAGASMKGEFEARLKSVLEEACASPDPVVLFIDEVHTLIGAGGANGTGDAANLLKPMLARGQLRTIGATTWSEFKRHIEKDPALTRRFQVLQVDEPVESTATAMLRGLVPMLEKHHGVWIMDEALQAAVRLSHRYIPARQLPDKAISLLDTACARVAVAQHALPPALQTLKFQMETIQTELALLDKARHFGKENEEQVVSLTQRLNEYQTEAEVLENCWSSERALVASIVATRQAIRDEISANSEDKGTLEQFKCDLAGFEAELEALRTELPLVQSEVNAEVIASIVADWTGIPVGQMLKDDVRAVLELPQRLAARVIGQNHALEQIGESIMIARAGLGDPQKPVGVFMLVGPSGIGKTETALAIAESLYGGEQNLITINMSEYQEAHTVSSLKGSPPGYVGYGEGGVLTEAVRRKPYSVVLLDEIEKAHPDVHELFYQVFDKGCMEDGEGRYIDFKNTIILLTSNVGSEIISTAGNTAENVPEEARVNNALHDELLSVFPAAFMGRMSVIAYKPLDNASLRSIVKLHLARLGKRLIDHYSVVLHYEDSVIDYIIEQAPVAETGVRTLIRFIEKNIMPRLGSFILQNTESLAGRIIEVVNDNNNEFAVSLR